jgi:hypothetical protein
MIFTSFSFDHRLAAGRRKMAHRNAWTCPRKRRRPVGNRTAASAGEGKMEKSARFFCIVQPFDEIVGDKNLAAA